MTLAVDGFELEINVEELMTENADGQTEIEEIMQQVEHMPLEV